MKVIDLLNMISKGEEVPKKIRFDNTNWNKVYGEKYVYYTDDCDNELFIYFFRRNLTFTLNDEVEIIEEDKKIKKIEQRTDTGLIGTDSVDMIEHTNRINRQAGYLSEIVSKINEIIDVINRGD